MSWSDTLFLRINAIAGTKPIFDRVMIFCARWLIFVLAAICFYLIYQNAQHNRELIIGAYGVALISAFLIHWFFAWLFPHKRPHIRFPQSTQLIQTLQNIKSFPSDHMTAATILVTIPFPLFTPLIFCILALLALCVGVSRVYCGVHFPRDILGGIVSGMVFSVLSPFLLFFLLMLLDPII